jgi:hypothetical protein
MKKTKSTQLVIEKENIAIADINRAIDKVFARELATMYQDAAPKLLERINEYGDQVLRLMIQYIVDDALVAPKIKGARLKYKTSDYSAARSQVFEFFKAEAHGVQDDGQTPRYRFRADFERAAYQHCLKHPVPGLDGFRETLPDLIKKWVTADFLPLFYPSHWNTRRTGSFDEW